MLLSDDNARAARKIYYITTIQRNSNFFQRISYGYAAMKLSTAVARRLLPAQRQSRAKNQSRNPEDTKGRRRRKGQLSQTTFLRIVCTTKLNVILGFFDRCGDYYRVCSQCTLLFLSLDSIR